MSRSNQTQSTQNPCTRWFEWRGSEGTVGYFDKEADKKVDIGSNFTFLVLDELATVKGWHDASDSGIFANEVRDTKAEPMVVRAFKGGTLAEGFYAQIRDRIQSHGGHFVANVYIAYKDGEQFKLGSMQFKGAALNAWVEFKKANRKLIYSGAIRITGFSEGQKGKVKFRVPTFVAVKTHPDTDAAAMQIDQDILQPYLAEYFKKHTVERAAAPAEMPNDEAPVAVENEYADEAVSEQKPDDDLPF